jgi:hypothetical protein
VHTFAAAARTTIASFAEVVADTVRDGASDAVVPSRSRVAFVFTTHLNAVADVAVVTIVIEHAGVHHRTAVG